MAKNVVGAKAEVTPKSKKVLASKEAKVTKVSKK